MTVDLSHTNSKDKTVIHSDTTKKEN